MGKKSLRIAQLSQALFDQVDEGIALKKEIEGLRERNGIQAVTIEHLEGELEEQRNLVENREIVLEDAGRVCRERSAQIRGLKLEREQLQSQVEVQANNIQALEEAYAVLADQALNLRQTLLSVTCLECTSCIRHINEALGAN